MTQTNITTTTKDFYCFPTDTTNPVYYIHFFICDSHTGLVETIDARETAPRNATENMFGNSTELSQKGNV